MMQGICCIEHVEVVSQADIGATNNLKGKSTQRRQSTFLIYTLVAGGETGTTDEGKTEDMGRWLTLPVLSHALENDTMWNADN